MSVSNGGGRHAHCQGLTARSGCGMRARWRPSGEQTPATPPGDPLGLRGYCSVGFPASSAQRSGARPLASIWAWSSGEENAMYPGREEGERGQSCLRPSPTRPSDNPPAPSRRTFAVGAPHGQHGPLQASEHQRWPGPHAHTGPARLKTPGHVVAKQEAGPGCAGVGARLLFLLRRAASHPAQQRQQLAAVTHAQAEGVRPLPEAPQLSPSLGVEGHGSSPPWGGTGQEGETWNEERWLLFPVTRTVTCPQARPLCRAQGKRTGRNGFICLIHVANCWP